MLERQESLATALAAVFGRRLLIAVYEVRGTYMRTSPLRGAGSFSSNFLQSYKLASFVSWRLNEYSTSTLIRNMFGAKLLLSALFLAPHLAVAIPTKRG